MTTALAAALDGFYLERRLMRGELEGGARRQESRVRGHHDPGLGRARARHRETKRRRVMATQGGPAMKE